MVQALPQQLKIALFLLVFSNAAWTGENYGGVQINSVTSIYDADTFKVNIDHWPEVIGHRVPVRVAGIDAPELRGHCPEEKNAARTAKQFTVNALRSGKHIELRNIQRGKYFRLLAEVWIDGRSLGDLLIKGGLAVRYDGGKKIDWCRRLQKS